MQQTLARLSNLPPPLLYWERLVWPPPPGNQNGKDGWPPPQLEIGPAGARLRLSQPFLPGLLRLRLGLAAPLTAPGQLTVRSKGWDHAETLAELPLRSGQKMVELSFKVSQGPVFFGAGAGRAGQPPVMAGHGARPGSRVRLALGGAGPSPGRPGRLA